jgi:hypothetical protein
MESRSLHASQCVPRNHANQPITSRLPISFTEWMCLLPLTSDCLTSAWAVWIKGPDKSISLFKVSSNAWRRTSCFYLPVGIVRRSNLTPTLASIMDWSAGCSTSPLPAWYFKVEIHQFLQQLFELLHCSVHWGYIREQKGSVLTELTWRWWETASKGMLWGQEM